MQNVISITKSYELQRSKEKSEIKKLILNGCEIKYFNGWIMINGKTFNGYNRNLIERLMQENGEE